MFGDVILPSAPKILYVRQDRIGDVFVSTPLVYALRQRYPEAQIDILVSRNNSAATFCLQSVVDQVHVLKKNSPQMLALLWKLRRTRYDLLIDLNHTASATSNGIVRSVRAHHSIVLNNNVTTPAQHVVEQGDRSQRHIIDVLCDLLLPLGISIERKDKRPRLAIRQDIMCEVKNKAHATSSAPVLAVQISGSSERRMYPAQALEHVIHAIRNRFPLVRIIILSAPADRAKAVHLAAVTGTLHLDPGPSYEHFAAAIASSTWLLSPDTAAIHVASAYNIPSVVLFSRDPRGFLNWLPYDAPCWPIITEHDSLDSIPPDLVVANLVSMMTC
ncbi:MAG: glycosyltransferase family 9 protein [Ignavibacteria bacterium]|nr:glycosyltransferase family 9 protein [Ignavibacteria bacterium]